MDRIVELFKAVGSKDYVGEAVTQEQHALQAAKFAVDSRSDEETVLAALLHDTGHLIGLQDPTLKQMDGGLGTVDHERLGASWLVSLGFSLKTAELVRRHVDAKRYLCLKNPAYHAKLSEASKGTLIQQGGPMGAEEAAQFEDDPLMDTIIKMRTWDENAKVVDPPFHVPELETYRAMVERTVQRQRDCVRDKVFQHFKLTEEQMDFWRVNGYLKLTDLLSEELKAQALSWASDIETWPATPGEHMVYFEKDSSAGDEKLMLCRTENFLPYHEQMRRLLVEEGPIVDVLEQLLGEPARCFKEKINYKHAGGGGFPAHQDAPAFTSFAQRNHLTLNIAIDGATPVNGCLQVSPGQHTKGLFPQDPVHFGLSKAAEESLHWIDVPLESGDALLFSSWLPHRSCKNASDRSRRALYVTYNGVTDGDFREQYYQAKRQNFPQVCERDPNKDYSEGAKTFNLATPIVG